MKEQLLQLMLKTVPDDSWPGKAEVIVVAISGGPDSVTLADLLSALSKEAHRDWKLHLAHMNHQLRGDDSEQDEVFVRELAKTRGWDLTVERVRFQLPTGASLEEAARNARYSFFEEVARTAGSRIISTAHHADDNVETILQRILRGTGLRGLAGIPATRPLRISSPIRVIRPLLNMRRGDLVAYLDAQGLNYRKDATNEQTEQTRNRIRNELLPTLEATYNPAVGEAIIRLAHQTSWVLELLQAVTDEAYRDLRIEEPEAADSIVLDSERLKTKPFIVQTEVVRKVIRELGTGEKKLTFEHILLICELASREVSGKQLALPGKLTVSKKRRRLILSMTG